MKRIVVLIVGIVLIPSLTGCADGPIRRWLRGGDCDTCPSSQPAFFNNCGPNGCAPPANVGNAPTGTVNDPYGIVPPGGNPGPGQN